MKLSMHSLQFLSIQSAQLAMQLMQFKLISSW